MGLRQEINRLRQLPLDTLLSEAWSVTRDHFPPEITFSAPSAKRYESAYFHNHPNRFATLSITGTKCSLGCDHCSGKILKSMAAADTPQSLVEQATYLAASGVSGVLISGGCTPMERFLSIPSTMPSPGSRNRASPS